MLGAGLVVIAQPAADQTRHQRQLDTTLQVLPDPQQIKWVASGQEELLSNVFWVRTVLIFGERYDRESGVEWVRWLRRYVETVNALDPQWRTPWFYGGVMLRVEGDIDGADAIFEGGAAHLPDDPFFPFSVGMNAYLYREDPLKAAEWIGRAAVLPGAPSWYTAAAARMRAEGGDRETAIRFLKETLETESDPAILQDTRFQLGRLMEEDLVSRWEGVCRAFEAEQGRPLASPGELEPLWGQALPPDPRLGGWVVGLDGVVRSKVTEDRRVAEQRAKEWALAGRE